jgi:hypothetical protein
VALHSLDAGNVSKTLEHTSLRLVPGEILPRHRKIYHLSPQDSAYLEGLLEHFIKYKCIKRANLDSNNHLYGILTCLMPQKKNIARLGIDHLPLINIIQSPPTILPDNIECAQSLQECAL